MAEHTSGWRSLLGLSFVYNFCQESLGSSQFRIKFVEKHVRPKAGMRILDLGCGPGTILDFLPADIDYVGVDLSETYIKSAQIKFGDRGRFLCLPVESTLEAGLKDFDVVLGMGLVHHLDDNQAHSFFSLASKAMAPKGRCVTHDPCLAKGQHPFARFMIGLDRGQNIRTAEGYGALAQSLFSKLDQHVYHDWLRIPYTHHIMECSL